MLYKIKKLIRDLYAKTIRKYLFKLKNCSVPYSVYGAKGLEIDCPNYPITIGEETAFTAVKGKKVLLQASEGPITIGKFCLISWNVTFATPSHSIDYCYADTAVKCRPAFGKPIVVEDYVWIGCNAIILPGVTIGKGSIIAAGSVVTKSIPENCVAAGIPARVIKKITPPEERDN